MQALRTLPKRRDWITIAQLLFLYSIIYLPIGFGSGFLKLAFRPEALLPVMIGAFFSPALSEELVFRVLLLPHQQEQSTIAWRSCSIGLSWIAFLLYHPFNPGGQPFFGDPVFLSGAGLLGIACTIAYLQSGSYWTAVFIHWLIVVVWLVGCGGLARFPY